MPHVVVSKQRCWVAGDLSARAKAEVAVAAHEELISEDKEGPSIVEAMAASAFEIPEARIYMGGAAATLKKQPLL